MLPLQVKCIDNTDNPYKLQYGTVYQVREISYKDGIPLYYYLWGVLGGWPVSCFIEVPMG
jgi:hypothetical protein